MMHGGNLKLQGTHLHTTSLWKSFQNWWQNAKVINMSNIFSLMKILSQDSYFSHVETSACNIIAW
jgi:hypothetical protein